MRRRPVCASFCPMEQALDHALRSGTLDAGWLAHTASCPACADLLLVADNLRQDSLALSEGLDLPDAAVLWTKAQARVQQQAIARATLPIRIARICTCVFAFGAAFRLAIELLNHPAWLDLGLRFLPTSDTRWLTAFSGTAVLGIALSGVFLAVSSGYVLLED
jgi:hypothetical protein